MLATSNKCCMYITLLDCKIHKFGELVIQKFLFLGISYPNTTEYQDSRNFWTFVRLYQIVTNIILGNFEQ